MMDDYTFGQDWNKPIRRKKMYTGFALDIFDDDDDEYLEENFEEKKLTNEENKKTQVKIRKRSQKKK